MKPFNSKWQRCGFAFMKRAIHIACKLCPRFVKMYPLIEHLNDCTVYEKVAIKCYLVRVLPFIIRCNFRTNQLIHSLFFRYALINRELVLNLRRFKFIPRYVSFFPKYNTPPCCLSCTFRVLRCYTN